MPLALGAKRTRTFLTSPGESENDPPPAESENGRAGAPTLPVMGPPMALIENESSVVPRLKVSDFGLTASLVTGPSSWGREAAMAVATKPRTRPENKTELTDPFIRGPTKMAMKPSLTNAGSPSLSGIFSKFDPANAY